MKRFLVFAFVALTGVYATSAEITEWATAVSKQKGTDRAIVFRYAKSFQPGFRRSEFPDRVIIVWKYNSDSGMPVVSEREAMDRMENLLAPLVESPGASVLALVSTGENLREWIFYAKSEDAFFAAFNRAFAGQSRFPIQIHSGPDASWSTYEQFRKGVRE